MRARYLITGILWAGLFLLLALAPLAIVFVGGLPAGRDVLTELSAGLGFVGLAVMCLQFVLTTRFRWLKAPYGSDIVYHFHRQTSLVALALVLAHPLVLFVARPQMATQVGFLLRSWVFWSGLAATGCLVVLVATSLWRRPMKLEYDFWRRAHAVLAVGAVLAGVAHVLLVDHYLNTPLKQALWIGYVLAWVGLLVYVRLVKPLLQLRSPYVVEEVRPERGDAYTLAIRPRGHRGFRFQPGQFAWLTLGDSPFSDREHPFSMSSSAARAPLLEFTIKEGGDWTRRTRGAGLGQAAYVDGPHGVLSVDRHPDAAGFVFIAGGIGITPFMSQLRTLADRRDHRPVTVLYANREWAGVAFREELERLGERLNLRVVHILSNPPDGWRGETGRIGEAILRRHLPPDRGGLKYFICGPEPMMDAAERLLFTLGVPLGAVDSERFNLV